VKYDLWKSMAEVSDLFGSEEELDSFVEHQDEVLV
jgi:hypothetical protein